tara:strand:- start:4005 stop:4556 length:552 start_codon:yes stop_codon:yes gene_type:complete
MKKEVIVLVVWFVVVSVPLSILMAQHNLPFSVDVKTGTVQQNSYLSVTHVLGAKCKCSKRIGRYLAEQPRPQNLDESIIIVDGELPNESELATKGFHISHVSVNGLKDSLNLESAPVLIVTGRDGQLKYSGGYKNIDEVDSRDIEIINMVQEGRTVASFPVMGCALSPALKTAMDPFQFRYKE